MIDEDKYNDDYFIFGGSKPFSRTQLFRVKNQALSDSKLHYVTIHSFRHSHASMLIDSNKLSVQDIAHRLGHSNPNITLGIYSHFFNKENNKISDVIDENLNNIVKTSSINSDIIKKPHFKG